MTLIPIELLNWIKSITYHTSFNKK